MKNPPLSYIEISKKNLIHNVTQFRRIVRKGTKIAGVVKANAYGHGDVEVVKILSSYVDYFQINSIEELEKIRPYTKKPILLLGYVGKHDITRAIKLGCILTVFDLHHALLVNESARKLGVKQKVHIALDAHLGREGILPSQAGVFFEEVKKMKFIVVDGVYAHFANIEDSEDVTHAEKQIKAYHEVIEECKKHNIKNVKTHLSATSGVLAYEKWNGIHTIVRLGIGLYGMWPSERLHQVWKNKIKLRPVLRHITHVAQVKMIQKGETIGYGLTYTTKKDTMTAVIPQGYSNGIPRCLSNKGYVLIQGKRVPILGRVTMNMFVVDVSTLKTVKPEDKVVILGMQKKQCISSEESALWSNTINYEVTTRTSPLLPRIII